MTIDYPKTIMTRTELLKMGIPKKIIDNALHCDVAHEFAEKIGNGRTAKWIIKTSRFEWYREQGKFNF